MTSYYNWELFSLSRYFFSSFSLTILYIYNFKKYLYRGRIKKHFTLLSLWNNMCPCIVGFVRVMCRTAAWVSVKLQRFLNLRYWSTTVRTREWWCVLWFCRVTSNDNHISRIRFPKLVALQFHQLVPLIFAHWFLFSFPNWFLFSFPIWFLFSFPIWFLFSFPIWFLFSFAN